MPNNKKAEETEARIRYLIPASIELLLDLWYAISMYNEMLSVSIPRKKSTKWFATASNAAPRVDVKSTI
jgi:hypothetical protein